MQLDSVSASIESHPGVTKGCAIFSEKVLYGFYSGPVDVGKSSVQEVVSMKQPYYAVPSKWIFRAEFSQTANGKTDKRALMSSVGLDISKLPAPAKPSTAQPALIKTPFKDLGTQPATPPHILHKFWER